MKALIPIDSDPLLFECCTRIKNEQSLVLEQIDFLKKRSEKMIKDLQEKTKQDWEIIESRLRHLGKIASENKDPNLSFSIEENIIYEKVQTDLPDFLKGLFK